MAAVYRWPSVCRLALQAVAGNHLTAIQHVFLTTDAGDDASSLACPHRRCPAFWRHLTPASHGRPLATTTGPQSSSEDG